MEQPYYLHWYTSGRRLPQTWYEPPSRPPLDSEIKWRILNFDNYVIDRWNRLWHEPYTTQHGRRRGWQPIRMVVKSSYAGFTLRKRGKPYWMSTRQLRRKLVRVDSSQ